MRERAREKESNNKIQLGYNCSPGNEILHGILSIQKFPLQTYNPSTSNTSKHITCGSSLCYTSNSTCPKESDDCEYTINYLSDNTSSSGILVEDVIHLASGTTITNGKSIEFPFVFGYVIMKCSWNFCTIAFSWMVLVLFLRICLENWVNLITRVHMGLILE